jgi:cell division protein ZapA (FtsZ GTPase activity inhibitor)
MSEEQSVTRVQILGEEYRIRGASPERITALAAYVDAKFRELERAGSVMDLKRRAVLVSLNIAEEIFDERDRSGRVLERLRHCRRKLEFAPDPEA